MSERSRGKSGYTPQRAPTQRYLLDNSLNPNLAAALSHANWDIESVQSAFHVSATDSVEDPEIIRYCAGAGQVWITWDEQARREHEAALKVHLVSVLWVQQPPAGMSNAFQFALLASGLIRVDYLLDQQPTYAFHLHLAARLDAQPRELWKSRRPRPGGAG